MRFARGGDRAALLSYTTRVRIAVFASLALALPACVVNLRVDHAARIQCRSEGECPEDFTCRTAIGFCVLENDPNDRPPELVLATWNRSSGRQGDTFSVSFEISEPLLFPPDVRLGDGGAAFALISDDGGTRFVFELVAAPPMPEGRSLEVGAIATDQNGNVASLTLGAVSFDFSPPRIYDLGWTLPAGMTAVNGAHPFGVSVQVESGASLTAVHVVALPQATVLADLSAVAVRTAHPTFDAFDAALMLDPSALAGVQALAVEVVARDAAGNETNPPHRGPSLAVDQTPPTIDGVLLDGGATMTTSFLVIARIAGTGASAVFIDGDLANSPSVRTWLPFATSAELPLYLSAQGGMKHVTVTLRDAAFNTSAPSGVDILLAPDTVPPSVDTFTITTPSPTQSLTVDLDIVASDNRGVIAGYLVRESSAAPTPAEVIMTPVPTSFTFTPGEGPRSLYAWAKDPADVRSGPRPAATVTIDQTPPGTIVFDYGISVPSPPLYTDNPVVPITASSIDTNLGERFAIREDGLTPAYADYQSAVPTHTLLGAPTTQGLHTLRLWTRDFAGNAAQAAGTLGVFFDDVNPVVSAFNVPVRPQTSPATGLTLTDSDMAPSSTVYRWRTFLDNATAPTGGQMNLSARPTSVTFSAGLHTLYAWAMDQAGNISAAFSRTYYYQAFSVGPTGTPSERSTAFLANGNLVVCYTTADASGDGAYCQMFPSDGSVPAAAFLVNAGATTGNQTAASVAADASNRFAVGYCDQGAALGSQYKLRLFDATGAPRTAVLTLAISGSCNTVQVVGYGNGYWYAGENKAVHVDADGAVLANIDPIAPGSRIGARSDGGAIVVMPGCTIGCYFGWARYTAAGAVTGTPGNKSPGGASSYVLHDVAMDAAGNYVIVWGDSGPGVEKITASCYDAADAAVGFEPGVYGNYWGPLTRIFKDAAAGGFSLAYGPSGLNVLELQHFSSACAFQAGVQITNAAPVLAAIARRGTDVAVAWEPTGAGGTSVRFFVAP